MTADLYELVRGSAPLLVSIPHAGTAIPDDIAAELTEAGRQLADTDWHVDRLYDFVPSTGATLIVARMSRYVIDLNRGPDGTKLYPGQAETELLPRVSFAGEALWRAPGPDAAEIARRRTLYWQPYHDTLARELARIGEAHGAALLLDAHSIASRVPRLFAGELPHLNFGTNGGASAADVWVQRLVREAGGGFTTVVNGRFKGGYITRHYGRPEAGVTAVQLEIAQRAYLDETQPRRWNPEHAAGLQAVLRRLVHAMLGG